MLVLLDVCTEVGGRSLSVTDNSLILDGGSLLVQLGLVLGEHVLLVLSDDGRSDRLDMLGGKNLVVLDGLDSVLDMSAWERVQREVCSLGGGGCASPCRQPRQSRRAPEVECAPG